jgi:alpha/beta hydrolase fold
VPLPESVQGIIAARLDALSSEEKMLLHSTAVMGKVVWLGAVERVAAVSRWQAEELLHRLERKEFVRRERQSSVEGETEYAFRHVLVRDVAYRQIPRAQRAALRHAGDHALALNAYGAAAAYFASALDVCPLEAPERPGLLYGLGKAQYYGEEQFPQALAEARDSLLSIGDVERAAEAETMVGQYWEDRSEMLAHHYLAAFDFARACTYDRANLGKSDSVATPRTSADVVGDLERLLRAAGIRPPYLLVGHSFGGLDVRLFAARHPTEVSGVVLVDPTPTTFLDSECGLVGASLCEELRAGWEPSNNPEGLDYVKSSAQVEASGLMPSVPVVVLAATNHQQAAITDRVRGRDNVPNAGAAPNDYWGTRIYGNAVGPRLTLDAGDGEAR